MQLPNSAGRAFQQGTSDQAMTQRTQDVVQGMVSSYDAVVVQQGWYRATGMVSCNGCGCGDSGRAAERVAAAAMAEQEAMMAARTGTSLVGLRHSMTMGVQPSPAALSVRV